MMTPAEFTAWLDTTAPGETIAYHRGSLARERKDWTDREGVKHRAVAGLDALARAVTKAADRGDVSLLQRRIGDGVFEYVARRTTPTAPPARLASYGRRLIRLDMPTAAETIRAASDRQRPATSVKMEALMQRRVARQCDDSGSDIYAYRATECGVRYRERRGFPGCRFHEPRAEAPTSWTCSLSR